MSHQVARLADELKKLGAAALAEQNRNGDHVGTAFVRLNSIARRISDETGLLSMDVFHTAMRLASGERLEKPGRYASGYCRYGTGDLLHVARALKEMDHDGRTAEICKEFRLGRSGTRTDRKRASKDEWNIKARDFLRKVDVTKVRRKHVADAIGCSERTVCKLPAWQTVQEELKKGRTPRAPKAVSLNTHTETTNRKAQMDRDAVLANLAAEQREDIEPSPLEDDPPDKPRRIKIRKRP